MKKLFFVVMTLFALVACTGTKKEAPTEVQGMADSTEVLSDTVVEVIDTCAVDSMVVE